MLGPDAVFHERVGPEPGEDGSRFRLGLEFLDSPGGRRLRRIVGTGLILSIPLVMRLPWLRASPVGRVIEITGGAALLIKLAEVIRDWERERPAPVVIDLPPAPGRPAA